MAQMTRFGPRKCIWGQNYNNIFFGGSAALKTADIVAASKHWQGKVNKWEGLL